MKDECIRVSINSTVYCASNIIAPRINKAKPLIEVRAASELERVVAVGPTLTAVVAVIALLGDTVVVGVPDAAAPDVKVELPCTALEKAAEDVDSAEMAIWESDTLADDAPAPMVSFPAGRAIVPPVVMDEADPLMSL